MLIKAKFSNQLLNAAAVFIGISVPSLVLGRAVIGVSLALALIFVLIAAPHREIYTQIREFLNKNYLGLIALALVATAINIPFSFRIDLSIEAWFRTWALAVALFYVFFTIKDRLEISARTICIALVFALLFILFNKHFHNIRPSKPVLNAFLLIIPVFLYFCFRQKHLFWILWGCTGFYLFVDFIFMRSARATLAGLIIMGLGFCTLFTLRRLNLKMSLGLFLCALASIVYALAIWMPDNINHTSTLSSDLGFLPTWMLDLHRQLIWTFAFDIFKESPWVGFGLNASNFHPQATLNVKEYFGPAYANLESLSRASILPSHPHNWAIELLIDSGVIGFIPFLACVVSLFLSSIIRFFKSGNMALAIFITINMGYWGTGLLNFSFWSVWWQSTYAVSALIMFFLYIQERETPHDN